MGALVSQDEAGAFLGLSSTDPIVGSLVEQAEAAFNAACGREEQPFADVLTGRVERLDGTGSRTLYVDYPIDTLTSITLGYDTGTPDETLVVADPTKVGFQAGKRRITRNDGGVFGCAGQPGYVVVTYTSKADLPADAKQAVLRRVALIYGQIGSEDARSEAIGGVRTELADADQDAVWREAVQRHRRLTA